MSIGAIIPAAGQGKRMGRPGNKLLLELGGAPVLTHALRAFQDCAAIAEIVIPAAAGEVELIRRLTREYGLSKVTRVLPGGAERQESVFKALRALTPAIDRVVIHDGARPLLTAAMLTDFLAAGGNYEAVITATPVKDTIKQVAPVAEDGTAIVLTTLPRTALRAVQTPQAFARALFATAHGAAPGLDATDDAALVENCGVLVRVLPGWEENIKITTEIDLWLAAAIMNRREHAHRSGL
jgi:2-C-methyl-D-erythritol 4-phosphate cytidylyltransferase